MAIKKVGGGAAKKGGKKILSWAWGKIFKRSFLVIVLLLLGGFLFNLDRMGNTGVTLLKYKKLLPGFIVKFLPGGSAVDGSAVPDEVIDGIVIEVYDGDTMTVLTENAAGIEKKYKVRFYGIDAPEADQDYGTESRDALREKILGNAVQVIVVSVDRYGRSIGKVMFGGRHINMEMIAEGNAWYYQDYAAHEYDFAKAEKDARARKLGLWSGKSPKEPWLYRKEKR